MKQKETVQKIDKIGGEMVLMIGFYNLHTSSQCFSHILSIKITYTHILTYSMEIKQCTSMRTYIC